MTAPKPAKSTLRLWLVKALTMAVVFYVAFGALLYSLQRHMLFFPHGGNVAPAAAGVPQMQVVNLTTADNLSIHAWFAPPSATDGKVIVFFHGNGDTLAGVAPVAARYMKLGYGFYLCEYRGYSGNPGAPTEQGLYEDARAGLKWLAGQGYASGRFVFLAHSLGTAVATQMATEFPPRALVLMSPFSSIAEMAKDQYPIYPVDLLLKDRFDSAGKIGSIKAPVLILHGTADTVVPFQYGQRLFAAAKEPKEFVAIQGANHNDLGRFGVYERIDAWLAGPLYSQYNQQVDKRP